MEILGRFLFRLLPVQNESIDKNDNTGSFTNIARFVRSWPHAPFDWTQLTGEQAIGGFHPFAEQGPGITGKASSPKAEFSHKPLEPTGFGYGPWRNDIHFAGPFIVDLEDQFSEFLSLFDLSFQLSR